MILHPTASPTLQVLTFPFWGRRTKVVRCRLVKGSLIMPVQRSAISITAKGVGAGHRVGKYKELQCKNKKSTLIENYLK